MTDHGVQALPVLSQLDGVAISFDGLAAHLQIKHEPIVSR
jgi:hypothetical protein